MPNKCKASSARKANSDYRQKYSTAQKLPKEVRQRQRQVQKDMKRR